jgi:hypothetical protein
MFVYVSFFSTELAHMLGTQYNYITFLRTLTQMVLISESFGPASISQEDA